MSMTQEEKNEREDYTRRKWHLRCQILGRAQDASARTSAHVRNVRCHDSGTHADRSGCFHNTVICRSGNFIVPSADQEKGTRIPGFFLCILRRLCRDRTYGRRCDNSALLPYACFGVACSGLLYLVLSLLIKIFGTGKVMRFFPPIVTGPIIIAIGLTLSQSAINNCSADWLIAVVAIALVVICNIWGKGMVKIVPIIIGVVGSYVLAAILGRVDFTPVAEAAWIGLPIHWNETAFWALSDGNTSLLITSVITIMPIALATMVEHIGDISAISSTVGINYIKEPGLHRTLLGDGLATIIASLFGAPANTTYGENTGVLSLTKVFDPRVIRIAAGFAVLFSFSPKVAALIGCMPTATCGGVSLVLYGMISAVGVRNIVETQVDFTKSRNVIIAALILVLSIGINYSAAGAIAFHIGEITISLSGLAVGALTGIILNAVLPGKDYKFDEDKPDDTGVCFAVKGQEN